MRRCQGGRDANRAAAQWQGALKLSAYVNQYHIGTSTSMMLADHRALIFDEVFGPLVLVLRIAAMPMQVCAPHCV